MGVYKNRNYFLKNFWATDANVRKPTGTPFNVIWKVKLLPFNIFEIILFVKHYVKSWLKKEHLSCNLQNILGSEASPYPEELGLIKWGQKIIYTLTI